MRQFIERRLVNTILQSGTWVNYAIQHDHEDHDFPIMGFLLLALGGSAQDKA